MATISFYHDTRVVRRDGASLLKLRITRRRKVSYIPLGIYLLPSQWDAVTCRVLAHPQQAPLNYELAKKRAELELFVLHQATQEGYRTLTAADLKNLYIASTSPEPEAPPAGTFLAHFRAFADKKTPTTRDLYLTTVARMEAYDSDIEQRRFEDITSKWLDGFNAFMAKTSSSQNYRNIHMRNIRAVFNDAIDEELTTYYPFRKFKIRPVPTRKRALSVEELRRLLTCEVEQYAQLYRDMFALIFMLIGINTVDLHRLKAITRDGRVEYSRAKTHRLYSVRVEPEALEIINRWRGESGLLCIADRWADHRNFRKQLNKAISLIGTSRKGRGGKKQQDGPFAGVSTYWARHTWATVAASLDIPKETIAAALGHGGNTVTDIYIDFDRRKVDEANRRVLDWVLYGKR